MKISLVVPCYNEAKVLDIFYEAVGQTMAGLPEYEYEVIFVDDGSKDDTLKIVKGYAEKDAHVKFLALSRNFGKESAMYAGLCNAKGDYVTIIDADMQDPISLLPEMVAKLESGEYDSVATRRVSRKGESKIKSFFSAMFYGLMRKISSIDMKSGSRDFRLMNRKMTDAVIAVSERNRFTKGIFGWVGFRTFWMEFENVARAAGKTKWGFRKLFKYSLDGIFNFSKAPLSIASWTGIIMTILSLLFGIFIIIRHFMGVESVEGWASLVCIIVFIGGVQLLCIGIIGQYLSRTFSEVKKRPIYIIRESSDDTDSSQT